MLTAAITSHDALSAALATSDGEPMTTDICMTRGDSRSFLFAIRAEDELTPIDLTNAIVRFAVRDQIDGTLLVEKATYDSTQVALTTPTLGLGQVSLLSEDTQGLAPGRYPWDGDVTRLGALVTNVGTATFTAGSNVVSLSGVDLTKLRPGQVFSPAGATSPNQMRVVITGVDSTHSTITTDSYAGWVNEAGVSLQVFAADRKTPVGLSGVLVLAGDVVA